MNIINSLFKFDCLPAFANHITFQLCKTEKGERYVHMKEDGADCFRRIIQNRKHPKIEPMIDGYSGFWFLDKNDMPMVALHWEKYFQHIREKYNSIYKVQMSSITPHVCRHTFCSNMAKSGMNPKTLQYIRGHSDIGVTLNTWGMNDETALALRKLKYADIIISGIIILIPGQNKEKQNNDKNTICLSRQNPYFCLKWLKIKAFGK